MKNLPLKGIQEIVDLAKNKKLSEEDHDQVLDELFYRLGLFNLIDETPDPIKKKRKVYC